MAAPASLLVETGPANDGYAPRTSTTGDAAIIPGNNAQELQFRPSINGWTPDLVNIAAAQADGGSLLTLADCVDAMLADDRVDGVLQTLTLGTFGLPLQLDGGDPGLLAQLKGKGPTGIGGEWNCMLPESELTQIYNWGVMLGLGLFQRKRLPRLPGHAQRFRIVHWHPRWLSYDHNASFGYHWRVQTKGGMRPVTLTGDGQFGLWLPFGEQRPWNQGKWRRVAFPWLVKRFSLEDRANQGEVVGSPTWVGTSTQGGTERQRQRFLDELRRLGRNGRIVLPEGWKLDLKEATGKTWEIFSESTDWADKAITISIASQVTTTEGAPGFDSGKTQDQILASVTRYYAKSFATCLYEQAVQPWARANGDEQAPFGYWITERTNSQASQATTFETLGRAIVELDTGLARSGLRIDGAELTKNFGVPVISDAGAPPIVQSGASRTPPKEPGTAMQDPVLP